MFQICTLFPTTILKSNIDREITSTEYSIVNDYKNKTYKNIGNTTSIDHYILENFFLSEIKEFIDLGIKEYADKIFMSKDVEFYITQSWLNYTETNQYHHKHNHSNSIISGVFYFNAEENSDKIIFHKNQYEQLLIPTREFNIYNTSSRWYPVKTGDLVLFPSSLQHEVDYTTSGTRISLAFNVFIRGTLGDPERMTAITIK